MADTNRPHLDDRTPREATPLRETDEPNVAADLREMVGLFCDAESMEHCVEELLTSGFDHGDISLLAYEDTVRKKLGHRLDSTLAAADEPNVPRRGHIDPETRMEGRGALAAVLGYAGAATGLGLVFATGGLAAPAVAAALVGGTAGVGLGVGLGRVYEKRVAQQMESQVQRGGILVWVRTRDTACEERAREILTRHGANHVHAHTLSW